jgi:sulfur-carrier protein
MIRVILPVHLRNLANVNQVVEVDLTGEVTIAAVLDDIEARYPMLRGTIRDHATKDRRPYIRFFACGEDLSHDPQDTPLPDAVLSGEQPFRVVGAMSGG